MASSSGSRQQGQLPPQGVQPTDTVNVITLLCGTNYEAPSMPNDDTKGSSMRREPEITIEDETHLDKVEEQVTKEVNEEKEREVQKPTIAVPEIKLPFPQRLMKTKLDQQFGKFLDMVKILQVTVPFFELINQVPAYVISVFDI